MASKPHLKPQVSSEELVLMKLQQRKSLSKSRFQDRGSSLDKQDQLLYTRVKSYLESKSRESQASVRHFSRIEGKFQQISLNFQTTMENATRDSARLMTDYKKKWIAPTKTIPLKRAPVPKVIIERLDQSRFETEDSPTKGSLERIRKSMDTHLYQSYLAEVAALNQVKRFLAERQQMLSLEHRKRLICQIINMQGKLDRFEESLTH